MIRGKLYATGKKKFEFEEFAQQKQALLDRIMNGGD